jgi:tRNA(Ile)-lysidine synthetase-like protein
LAEGNGILVGCSGGPDSIALLHVLISLRAKLSFRVAVAHVNYRIRGAAANGDERLVRDVCTAYKIPLYAYHPRGMKSMNEERLREVRYRFFGKIREREDFDTIAVAHTEDDQAETVLIRLLRGTGREGISAMHPRNGTLIRPFLGIAKADILDFLSAEGIAYGEDATNLDRTILRNRIRHELLPLLEREYRPGIRKVLSRTAQFFSDSMPDESVATNTLRIETVPDGYSFSVAEFRRLSAKAQAGERRSLYRLVSDSGKYPESSFIREASKCILSIKGKVRTYGSKRLKIVVKGDRVAILRPF